MNESISMIGRNVMMMCGALIAIIKPTIPFIIICTIAVFMDCVTAWLLSRRVKKMFPGKSNGKFKSHDFGRVLLTLIKVFSLIVLVHLIDTYILPDISFRLANIVAGAVCFWQVWSMLENESSCNNAKWAKIAQRIMVDKTERHFDIDLHELKDDDSGGGAACETSKCPPKDNKPKTEEADGEG